MIATIAVIAEKKKSSAIAATTIKDEKIVKNQGGCLKVRLFDL